MTTTVGFGAAEASFEAASGEMPPIDLEAHYIAELATRDRKAAMHAEVGPTVSI